MHTRNAPRAWVLALWAAVAGPVVSADPAENTAPSAILSPHADGLQRLSLVPAESDIRIRVFRGGRAARFGHNHVLTAPQFSGALWVPAEGLAGAGLQLSVPLAALEVDPPGVRATLGPGFDSDVPDTARTGTRDNMLGPRQLDATRFPTVEIRSMQVVGEGRTLAVQAAITLHGHTRHQWLPVVVDRQASHVRARGTLVLLQTDFGIEPLAVLGGLLAVQDPLVLEFDLVAR